MSQQGWSERDNEEDDLQYHQLLNVQSDSGISDGEGGPRSLKTLVPRTRAVYTPKKRAEKDKARAPRKEYVPATTARRPVVCTCTAEYYDMQRLFQHYTHLAMRPTVFDDVVHIKFGARHTTSIDAEASGNKFDVFFFSYGVFVCWGVGENEVAAIRREVAGFESKVLDEEEFEEFDYAHADKFYIDRLKDEIVLNSDLTEEEDIIAKCAISHGLALGVKLAVFEEAIEKTIQGTKHLPEDLSLDGTINMSSKDISRIIGELFIQRNCVNLHSDILGVPDFFWENSELVFYSISCVLPPLKAYSVRNHCML